MGKNEIGYSGQRNVAALLVANHRIVRVLKGPRDFLVDGKFYIEVKTALPRRSVVNGRKVAPFWKFNIHRDGVIREIKPDAYILRLESIPWSTNSIHLLLPGSCTTLTVDVGFRSLLNQQWAEQVADFYRFLKTGELPERWKK